MRARVIAYVLFACVLSHVCYLMRVICMLFVCVLLHAYYCMRVIACILFACTLFACMLFACVLFACMLFACALLHACYCMNVIITRYYGCCLLLCLYVCGYYMFSFICDSKYLVFYRIQNLIACAFNFLMCNRYAIQSPQFPTFVHHSTRSLHILHTFQHTACLITGHHVLVLSITCIKYFNMQLQLENLLSLCHEC